MNLDEMTLEDCIEAYNRSGHTVIINDGAGSFCEEPVDASREPDTREDE